MEGSTAFGSTLNSPSFAESRPTNVHSIINSDSRVELPSILGSTFQSPSQTDLNDVAVQEILLQFEGSTITNAIELPSILGSTFSSPNITNNLSVSFPSQSQEKNDPKPKVNFKRPFQPRRSKTTSTHEYDSNLFQVAFDASSDESAICAKSKRFGRRNRKKSSIKLDDFQKAFESSLDESKLTGNKRPFKSRGSKRPSIKENYFENAFESSFDESKLNGNKRPFKSRGSKRPSIKENDFQNAFESSLDESGTNEKNRHRFGIRNKKKKSIRQDDFQDAFESSADKSEIDDIKHCFGLRNSKRPSILVDNFQSAFESSVDESYVDKNSASNVEAKNDHTEDLQAVFNSTSEEFEIKNNSKNNVAPEKSETLEAIKEDSSFHNNNNTSKHSQDDLNGLSLSISESLIDGKTSSESSRGPNEKTFNSTVDSISAESNLYEENGLLEEEEEENCSPEEKEEENCLSQEEKEENCSSQEEEEGNRSSQEEEEGKCSSKEEEEEENCSSLEEEEGKCSSKEEEEKNCSSLEEEEGKCSSLEEEEENCSLQEEEEENCSSQEEEEGNCSSQEEEEGKCSSKEEEEENCSSLEEEEGKCSSPEEEEENCSLQEEEEEEGNCSSLEEEEEEHCSSEASLEEEEECISLECTLTNMDVSEENRSEVISLSKLNNISGVESDDEISNNSNETLKSAMKIKPKATPKNISSNLSKLEDEFNKFKQSDINNSLSRKNCSSDSLPPLSKNNSSKLEVDNRAKYNEGNNRSILIRSKIAEENTSKLNRSKMAEGNHRSSNEMPEEKNRSRRENQKPGENNTRLSRSKMFEENNRSRQETQVPVKNNRIILNRSEPPEENNRSRYESQILDKNNRSKSKVAQKNNRSTFSDEDVDLEISTLREHSLSINNRSKTAGKSKISEFNVKSINISEISASCSKQFNDTISFSKRSLSLGNRIKTINESNRSKFNDENGNISTDKTANKSDRFKFNDEHNSVSELSVSKTKLSCPTYSQSFTNKNQTIDDISKHDDKDCSAYSTHSESMHNSGKTTDCSASVSYSKHLKSTSRRKETLDENKSNASENDRRVASDSNHSKSKHIEKSAYENNKSEFNDDICRKKRSVLCSKHSTSVNSINKTSTNNICEEHCSTLVKSISFSSKDKLSHDITKSDIQSNTSRIIDNESQFIRTDQSSVIDFVSKKLNVTFTKSSLNVRSEESLCTNNKFNTPQIAQTSSRNKENPRLSKSKMSHADVINEDYDLSSVYRASPDEVRARPVLKTLNYSEIKKFARNCPFSELRPKKSRKKIIENEPDSIQLLKDHNKYNSVQHNSPNKKVKNVKIATSKNKSLVRPKKWVTKRLYNFLFEKLLPTYGIRYRLEAQNLVLFMVEKVTEAVKKSEGYDIPVEELKMELALKKIVETNRDFFNFVENFLEDDFYIKSVPTSRPMFNKPIVRYVPGTMDDKILQSVENLDLSEVDEN